jgi:hypothetical protein
MCLAWYLEITAKKRRRPIYGCACRSDGFGEESEAGMHTNLKQDIFVGRKTLWNRTLANSSGAISRADECAAGIKYSHDLAFRDHGALTIEKEILP